MKVLNHYRGLNDTLKYQAAYYLISNMTDNFTLKTANKNPFISHFQQIRESTYISARYNDTQSYCAFIIDSILTDSDMRTIRVPDIEDIKADYLIQNIDIAFEKWNTSPWWTKYKFNDMLEYVLPYRFGNEILENWRTVALTKKLPNEDSLVASNELFNYSLELFHDNPIGYTEDLNKYPFDINYSEMQQLQVGTCDEIANLALALMRSRGIPSAVDKIPVWANRNGGHAWNVIIMPNGKCKDIGYYGNGSNIIFYKVSKIYRICYSKIKDILYDKRNSEKIPDFFSKFNMRDVTNQYDIPLSDIEVQITNKIPCPILWVCTFDNKEWRPVAYANVQDRVAHFKNLGRGVLWSGNKVYYDINVGDGIVYLPAYYNGSVLPASNPIILYANGTYKSIKVDLNNKEQVILTRKYPKFRSYIHNENRMRGLEIQGANKSDFSDSFTIYTVNNTPPHSHPTYNISDKRPYRYIRFVLPKEESINVSELCFMKNMQKQNPRTMNASNEIIDNTKTLFDNNVLTSCGINSRTIFDLSTSMSLSSIKISLWTDDNDITPGCQYRLLYWDNGWNSLGDKVSDDYTLIWDAPVGALLWLRNISYGKEERIFTYENGKQIWW